MVARITPEIIGLRWLLFGATVWAMGAPWSAAPVALRDRFRLRLAYDAAEFSPPVSGPRGHTETIKCRESRCSNVSLVAALSPWLLVAFPAQAKAATVHLKGVQTTLTTDPVTIGVLFGAGIIPLPLSPSAVTPTALAARYTFPVTAGAVNATTPTGRLVPGATTCSARRPTSS
jgi:hypothetical protein